MAETSIITIANQKGGVGKTTTVVNLASAYAQIGKRVLVIDLDYQCNASALLGVDDNSVGNKSIAYALQNDLNFSHIVMKSNMENVDLLAATRDLDLLREKFSGQPNQFKLVDILLNCEQLHDYDIVIIDTHPSLDCFFQSAMAASHYYLIPLFAEADSSKGLAHMVTAVEKIRRYLNPMLNLLGCIITCFDKSNATHIKFEKFIRDASKEGKFNVFETTIPSSKSVAAASAHSMPLHRYKKSSPVTVAYSTLAGEILPHLKGKRTGRKPLPVNIDVFNNHNNDYEEQAEL